MFEKFIHLKLFAVGNVVDVGYRSHCCQVAKKLGVTGYANNLEDARVEVVAECEPPVATEFLRQIRYEGHVTSLDIVEVELVKERKYKTFTGGGVYLGVF